MSLTLDQEIKENDTTRILKDLNQQKVSETEQAEATAYDSFVKELADMFVQDIESAGEFSTDRGNWPAKNIAGDHCYAAWRQSQQTNGRIVDYLAELRVMREEYDGSEVDTRKMENKTKFIKNLKLQRAFFDTRLHGARIAYRQCVEEGWVEPGKRKTGTIGKATHTATLAEIDAILDEMNASSD